MSKPISQRDKDLMARAIRLAKKGNGWVSPNPQVGAVITKNGKIIAEGYHHRFGAEHAEIDALSKLDFKAPGCEMHVNLEPCAHRGNTPPCADAIIKAGMKHVTIAMVDPNPQVSGKGIRKLQKAGVGVSVGILEDEATELNRAFIKYITTCRPFVVAKAAVSLDGKIATYAGDSGQTSGGISGEAAHSYVHRLRRDLDAILVGTETVLADNPQLTCRLKGRYRQPVRIVLDEAGKSPLDSKLFDISAAPTIVATSRKAPAAWKKALTDRGVEIELLPVQKGRLDLGELMNRLGARKIGSLLVEGGGFVLGSFLENDLIDRLDIIYTSKIIGGDGKSLFSGSRVKNLADCWETDMLRTRRLGNDLLVQGYMKKK